MIPIYECENREKTRTIHIEITNACNLQCSNCTRFVGHHRKPYFMDLAKVEESLISLIDFPGNVGIMGGEPTLHPEFLKILELMEKYIKEKSRRGLWTDGFRYKKYKEKIESVFFPENITYNSHDSNIEDFHQPLLIHPSDIGISSEDHKKFINNCWIQRRWSASITPKGGFFCEVAAAKDMLFNGEGGYSLEDKWWNKTPEQFKDQVNRYCFDCSACIPLNKVSALEGNDYVSKKNLEKLIEVKSPKVRRNKIKEVTIEFAKLDKDLNKKPWEHRKIDDCQYGDGIRYLSVKK